MEILLALIIVSLVGIFIRRYYISEKGIYLEKALARKFFGRASHIHRTHKKDEKSEEIQPERKAPSHAPKSVPKTMEAKMLYSRAMIFYERGDLDQAEKKLIEVTSLDQNFSDAIHRLGLIYLKQSQFSKAEALFRQLVSQIEHDAIYHSNLGRALYEQEKFEDALGSYLKAIEIDNSRPGRFVSTAEVYRQIGNKEKAREMYDAALKLDPTNIDYLLTYAHFLIEEKDLEKATPYLDKVLKIQPDNPVALEMKSECE
jgi:type IV pilus assembly protein PilF